MKEIKFTKKQLYQLPDGLWQLVKRYQGNRIKKKLPLDLPPRKLTKKELKEDANQTSAPAQVIKEAFKVISNVVAYGKNILEADKLRQEKVATLGEIFEIYLTSAKAKYRTTAKSRKEAINTLCYVVAIALDWPEANCVGSKLRAEKRKEKVGKLPASILTEEIIEKFSEFMFKQGPKRYKYDGLKPHERGEDGELTDKEVNRVNISIGSFLTMARMPFAKRLVHSRKGIYTKIKLPDLTDFLESGEGEKTEIEPYQMPGPEALAKLNRGLPDLKANYPEAYKCYMCERETGARLKEARLMMWENFAENIEDGLTYTFTDTKNDRPRTVPFSKKLYAELLDMQTDDDYVIGVPAYYTPRKKGRDRGDSYRKHRLGKEISTWMRSCGWKRRQTNHENRKVFGTLVAQQTNLRTVQYVLGHSDYKTTEKHYVAHADKPKYESLTDAMPRGEGEKKSRKLKAA